MKAWLRHTISFCREWLNDTCCDSSTLEDDVTAENRRARQGKIIASLLLACGRGEPVIPSPKWRKLYGKWIAVGPDGAEALRRHFEKQLNEETPYSVPKFRVFNLQGLRIGDAGIRVLGPIIEVDKSISSLILCRNGITDAGISTLLMHLPKSPGSLRVLWLVDNPVTALGIKLVLCSFVSYVFPVEELSLSRGCVSNERKMKPALVCSVPPITPVYLAEDVESFLKLITKNDSNLKYFSYRGNHFADFGANDFGKILEAAICSQSIKHFVLQECYTSQVRDVTNRELVATLAAPFEMAAKALQSIRATLTTLELQVPLSDEAVAALASGISSAVCLLKLSLRGCYMSAEGLRIFSENAISSNRTIISLDLSYQSEEVAHPLCGSHWMSRFHAGNVNSSVKATCRPLLPVFSALRFNRTLEELEVMGIDILPDDVEELCACIESGENTVIQSVKFSELNSEPLVIKLESLLGRNRNTERDLLSSFEGTRSSSVLDIHRKTPDVAEDENKDVRDAAQRQCYPLRQQPPYPQIPPQRCSTAKPHTNTHSQPHRRMSSPLDSTSPGYVDSRRFNSIIDFTPHEAMTIGENSTSTQLTQVTSSDTCAREDSQVRRRKNTKWNTSSVANTIFSPQSDSNHSYKVAP